MKPVNLLPPSARPYVSSGGKSTSTYALLGVLGLLVVAAVVYVSTTNKITTSKDQIQTAQAEQAQAQAKAASLQSYGTYSQIASTRISTVASLAVGRIDYERLMRETARVLPSNVWLNSMDAEAGTGGGTSATPTAASATGSGQPTVHLIGCAKNQDDVAATLVRLRAIHGSDDVALNTSTKPLGVTASATSGDGGSVTGCGTNYAFDILVNLEANKINGAGDFGDKVPSNLGGGS
ncbi:MAG TPA: PilN domain-containing protein [Gaiellales bacterium]|nr:PilN domain-containing protein [Gaiellales bacterium]